MKRLAYSVADGAVVAKRNVIKIKRVPDVLVWVLMSPIMFVLLFAYVFGGAIDPGGGINYREFLIAGIFTQTVVFGATFTGAGMAEDMQKGIIDRFRSLPMSRSAVLVGRTVSDVIYNVLSVAIMALTGLIIGWAIRGTFVDAVTAFALLLLFSYAFSWVMAYVGLLVPSPDVINNASFMVIMPLTFVSNAFVPIDTFPGPLQRFAEWNPVSAVTQASRQLFGNLPDLTGVDAAVLQAQGVRIPTPSDAWSMQHPVAYSLIWVVIILAVFVPLSVRQYKRTARR
ncbi:MAG: ABC transporter permease [Thermoleophilia bacterium]|nr:ABC transporter permease [Thermoleophilia bacterium]